MNALKQAEGASVAGRVSLWRVFTFFIYFLFLKGLLIRIV